MARPFRKPRPGGVREMDVRSTSSKFEFFSLLAFLVAATLLLTNGFLGRISAQSSETDVYASLEPLGVALDEVMQGYVREVEIDTLVEGALVGIMSSLDRNSSFISEDDLKKVREDTQGEFEGIGIRIKLDDKENLMVFAPIAGSPASEVGIQPFDIILKIDDVAVTTLWKEGMSKDEKLSAAAKRIRGPRGTTVKLGLYRAGGDGGEEIEVVVRRDRVPIESIKESRLLPGGIGYVSIEDFKDTTADDLRTAVQGFLSQGMKAFVLDLRWNPGGLLTASQQTCELFLPKGSLVTYTKSRPLPDGQANPEDMELRTRKRPILPPDFPLIVLVNGQTASSAEIVTGALQYHRRAIVIGQRTWGKGSVQTIIPLRPARTSALRLTTALYYTPAGVTIDHQGILPDVELETSREDELRLARQMYASYKDDPSKINEQNHGTVTGNEVIEPEGELPEEREIADKVAALYGEELAEDVLQVLVRKRTLDMTIEDVQLKRAVEIFGESSVWEELVAKYHRAVSETQTAAAPELVETLSASERLLLGPEGNGSEKHSEEEAVPEEAPAAP